MASRARNQGRYAPSRRMSTNNPFRMSMVETDSVPLSPNPVQDWMGSSSHPPNESHESQYIHAPHYSTGSSQVNSPIEGGFRKSTSPSTNPFLEDVEDEYLNRTQSDNGAPIYPRTSSNSARYPTASGEKQRLRDRYNETENFDGNSNNNNHNSNNRYREVGGGGDLPPSYEEVAGPSKAKSPFYPREKGGVPPAPRDPRIGNDREAAGRHRYSHYNGPRPPAPPPSKLGTSEPHRRYDYPREHSYHRDRDYDQEYYSDKEARDRERSYRYGPPPPHHSHRHHHERTAPALRDKKPKKPPKNVDTIDKMDVTALFGGSFHHDGPFDAVTPHRNKNAKAPPVLAFPADGPNNSIGGAPLKKNAMDEVFGRNDLEEDDDIYQTRPKTNVKTTVYGVSSNPASANGSTSTLDAIKPGANSNITAFDPRGRIKTVEGPTTDGLGSTTFLDGAPASHKAIETDVRNHARQTRLANSGLQRNKSLSQKLAGSVKGSINGNSSNNNSGGYSRNFGSEGPQSLATSNNGHLGSRDEEEDVYLGLPSSDLSRKKSAGTKLMRRVRSMKVGRR